MGECVGEAVAHKIPPFPSIKVDYCFFLEGESQQKERIPKYHEIWAEKNYKSHKKHYEEVTSLTCCLCSLSMTPKRAVLVHDQKVIIVVVGEVHLEVVVGGDGCSWGRGRGEHAGGWRSTQKGRHHRGGRMGGNTIGQQRVLTLSSTCPASSSTQLGRFLATTEKKCSS